MTSTEMCWDLSQLVKEDDPEYILKQLKSAVRASARFRNKHRGNIANYGPQEVYDLLNEADKLQLKYEGPMMYSSLRYSADMTDEIAKQLHDKAQQTGMMISQNVAFLDIELGKLLSKKPELVEAPELAEYKHKLERILRRVPHMLPEEIEKVIIIKDRNGIQSWYQLFGDWLATRTFEIEINGEKKVLPYGEIIGYYHDKDRDLRRHANEIVYSGLGKDLTLWASAMRAIFKDHLQMCKLRNWPSPMTQSLIDNDVDQKTINSLMKTIEKNVGVYQEYLELKAKVMGLKKLGNWDLTAPLPNAPEKKFKWSEARDLVVQAYSDFDEQSGKWIEEMYVRRHIDGEVRHGKRSGAFCATWHKGKSAYVLQSFNGNLGDVYTQAHELGHALHAYLGTRAQKPSNYEIGSCIAETGSIFGELLLTEKLLDTATSNEERQAVLATVLDEFGQAAFQVSARVFFETSLYEAIERGEFLDGEKISDYWVEARTKIYGDAVEWLPELRYWWTMKLHFYLPGYRYYNYPYVYAQLFVYAMYRLYKEQGKDFVPKLKALLSAGSSKSPRDLAAEIGFDITKPKFWQKGIDQFAEFIEMFRQTI